jgi:hypothetical protein
MLTLKKTLAVMIAGIILLSAPANTFATEITEANCSDPLLKEVENKRTVKIYNSQFKLIATHNFKSEADFLASKKLQTELSGYDLLLKNADNLVYIKNSK